VVDRLHDLGVEKISYSGGEPLKFPFIEEYVKYASELGFKQILTTNGDFLIDHNIPQWLSLLEYLKLSFYGDVKLHNQIMGVNHYEDLVFLMQRLSKLNYPIGTNFMLCKKSLSSLHQFLQDLLDLNIDNILINTYIPTRRMEIDNKYGPLDNEDINKAKNIILDYKKSFNNGIKIHDYRFFDSHIILDEDNHFTLPSKSCRRPKKIGGIYDHSLSLPSGEVLDSNLALDHLFQQRHLSNAIISEQEIV